MANAGGEAKLASAKAPRKWRDLPAGWAALAGSILTFVGGVLGVAIASVWGEYTKNEGTVALERQKFEIGLVQDALRSQVDQENRMKTLMFMACNGFLPTFELKLIKQGNAYGLSCDGKDLLIVPSFRGASKFELAICKDFPNCDNVDTTKFGQIRACFPKAGVPENTLMIDFILNPDFERQRNLVAACMGL